MVTLLYVQRMRVHPSSRSCAREITTTGCQTSRRCDAPHQQDAGKCHLRQGQLRQGCCGGDEGRLRLLRQVPQQRGLVFDRWLHRDIQSAVSAREQPDGGQATCAGGDLCEGRGQGWSVLVSRRSSLVSTPAKVIRLGSPPHLGRICRQEIIGAASTKISHGPENTAQSQGS